MHMRIKRYISLLIMMILLVMNTEAMDTSANAATVLSSKIKQVAIGGEHRMVVLENGELWGWGDNLYGQIGDGTDYNVITKPKKIMDGVATAKVSTDSTYVLKNNGELWGWGDIGARREMHTKKPVKQMDGVKGFYIGLWYVMVINDKNELWGWGANYNGQVGDGTLESVPKPKKIMDNVTKVYPDIRRTYAINDKGELWGWGNNKNGIIAVGRGEIVKEPIKVMDGVNDVFSSIEHVMVIKGNGELWGWGVNEHSRIGDGTKMDVLKPKKVIDEVKNAYFEKDHTFVIKTNGELWGWGRNNAGQIGAGFKKVNGIDDHVIIPIEISKPVKIMDDVVQLSISEGLTKAIKNNGELWEWGSIGNITLEEIGDNRFFNVFIEGFVPRKVMEDVVQAAAGRDHTIAVNKRGEVFAWGSNSLGQTGSDLYPDFVATPKKVIDGAEKIFVWGETTAVITTNGDLWSWGFNGNALVGDGTQKDVFLPKKILSINANVLK
ncbi:MAG TPA: hypothetical protein VEB00_02615 [Clostridia bacterium]|nr:hypothetical protein [Clostridia bacterium]